MAPRVAYFYDPDIGSYYYGPGHPMKPQRIRMAHSLILSYDLYKELDVFRPHQASHVEMCEFHDSSYVNFLSEVGMDNVKQMLTGDRGSGAAGGVIDKTGNYMRFNLIDSADCPVFDGLYEFQSSCAGGTIDCAKELNYRNYDVTINWSGGLHHAKRSEASGFCYINDIVLGILELLKYHTRVLYIDIDVHHGDGVEEAFYLSHRVMTVSLHKYGEFFPGTGDINDVGSASGKYYSLNIPLDDGVTDEQYYDLYITVIQKVLDVYRPEAIVLQCGADSITGDRLGTFNMTTKGHGACVEWTKNLGIPLIILGGGGYTIRNVARAWLYETAILLGKGDKVSETIPINEYYEYFGPFYNLHLQPDPTLINKNSDEYIHHIKTKALKHLSHLEHAPSVQFSHVPADFFASVITNDNDPDEIDQYNVEWDGGGLSLGAKDEDIHSLLLPQRLRRKNDRNFAMDSSKADNSDRDQKKAFNSLKIAPGHHDEIVDGD